MHDTPSQDAVALAGAVHGVQDAPQLAVLELLTHTPPQLWKPPLQVKPQETPSQVAEALAGGVQAEHDAPQLVVLKLLTQTPPQL